MGSRSCFCSYVIAGLALMLNAGCGGVTDPVHPAGIQISPDSNPGHACLGLWKFAIDPANETLVASPIRSTQMHLNALAFIEPPAGVLLKIDQIVDFSPGQITVDIKLTHPYPSATGTAAFDVCGILIGHGGLFYPLSDKLFFAGPDDVQLLNPDGYTRWWNPVEFPENISNPSGGYIDGLLGKPQSQENFDTTLNGYKYFASDLTDPASDLSGLSFNMRGAFVPGTSCTRRYVIGFTPGNLVFNYAVDANWAPPGGTVPHNIPGDFPPSANRPEAYRIELHNILNSLAYDPDTGSASGILSMSVWVYDWFEAGSNTICAYPMGDALMGGCNPFPAGGNENYSVFNADLWPMSMTSADDVLVWVEAECEEKGYQGAVPDKRQASYIQYVAEVAEQ